MRNIGGSFGIATMTTFLARRQQVHQNQLISHVTSMDTRTQNTVHGLQSWFQLHGLSNSQDAAHKAWGTLYLMVQQQASMLSFVEAFWVMGVIFWAMLPLLFLLRNARDLHPRTPAKRVAAQIEESRAEEPEPELVSAGTFD